QVDGEPLPFMDVLAWCFIIVIAGNETTRNGTSGGMLAFIEHQSELRKLQTDSSLLVPAVEEVVRWTSPIIHFGRTATRDVEIGAFRVCELPVRAEREQLAVLVHAVDEHAVRAELLAARERVDYRTRERALVARRVRLRIVEADLALRDHVVPERRDRGLAAVALPGRIERRRADRILDHAVVGEQVEPLLALAVRDVALRQETRAARGVFAGHR